MSELFTPGECLQLRKALVTASRVELGHAKTAKHHNDCELTEAHRHGMLAALINHLESELAPSGENHASKNNIQRQRKPVAATA